MPNFWFLEKLKKAKFRLSLSWLCYRHDKGAVSKNDLDVTTEKSALSAKIPDGGHITIYWRGCREFYYCIMLKLLYIILIRFWYATCFIPSKRMRKGLFLTLEKLKIGTQPRPFLEFAASVNVNFTTEDTVNSDYGS